VVVGHAPVQQLHDLFLGEGEGRVGCAPE
jgi:hypothetical protein